MAAAAAPPGEDTAGAAPAGQQPWWRPVRIRPDVGLVAALAAGAGLRLWGIGAQSLWYDEWLTTEATAGGLGDVLRHVARREGITPPYFLVMWVWARLFGDGEVALRSFSALCGVATIAVAYGIARELGRSRRVARVAAALVAVSPMLVWYSQEARPYSLLALAGGLSVQAFARARRTGTTRDLTLWAAVAAGAVALHYFVAFLVAAEAVALLVERRVAPRRVVRACLPTGAVLLLLVPFALEQHSHDANRDWISGFTLTSRLQEAARSALVGPSLPSPRAWLAVAGVVAVAAGLGAVVARGDDRRAAVVLAAVAAVAVGAPLAAAVAGTDVFLGRYVIAALVPAVVAVAIGLAAGGVPRWVAPAGVAVVAVASLGTVAAVQRDDELQRADWRAVAEVVDGAAGGAPRLLVVNVNGGQSSALRHYLPGLTVLDGDDAVRVDQVDVLVGTPADRPCNMLVGRACGMVFLGAPLPPATAGSFSVTERIDAGPFAVDRYRSPAPVAVTRDDLVHEIDRAGAVVWVLPG
ncbi:MAG TPA: glycosyltransferase family 39 protein [Acidimicrobiales bacterium]|nr:glycosyltransferase family 39 protein [Acidimicrobiales bacterium]